MVVDSTTACVGCVMAETWVKVRRGESVAERNRGDATCRWFDAGQKPEKGGGGREEGGRKEMRNTVKGTGWEKGESG